MKWVVVLVLFAAAGAGVWFHFSHTGEAKKMEDQAQRDAIFAEMKVSEARIAMLDKYVASCKNHNAPDAKMDGAYDGFSYNKESDYVKEKQEQEQRYKDLQSRLNGAYGK